MSNSIDEDTIVTLNEHRRKVQRLFDQIPLETFEYQQSADELDLNNYREWLLDLIHSSHHIGNTLSAGLLQDMIQYKEKKHQLFDMEEEIQVLQVENDDLKSILGLPEEEDNDFMGYKEGNVERILRGTASHRGSTFLNKKQSSFIATSFSGKIQRQVSMTAFRGFNHMSEVG